MPTPKAAVSGGVSSTDGRTGARRLGIGDLAREFGRNVSSIHAWEKAAAGLDGSHGTITDAPLSMNERQVASS